MRSWIKGFTAAAFLLPGLAFAQCVSLTTGGVAYNQNFDTLSNTAGSTTNNLTITGWFMTETGGGARDNEQYAVDTGASTTGDTYSYGAAAATDRAIGGLQSGTLIPVFGSCYTNNTGASITSLAIAYTGEQWRLGTAARTDQISFEYSTSATDLATGTWTGVAALNFVTPDTGTTGAKNGNAVASRTALSTSIGSLSIPNGATFWIRWIDTNASGADDGLSVDDFSLTPTSTGVTPGLTINDASLTEGDSGSTVMSFTVSLSAPAGPGGVTFDIATADNSATSASGDFVAKSLTSQTIAAGNNSYTFDVTINGDTAVESNETFFVNVINVTGANVADGQGQGTIQNDDVVVTPIHQIQGSGLASPLNGSSIVTEGIVTAQKFNNGFFLQTPDANVDGNPATSEGIFVFTSTAPPASAAVGNRVRVSATVTEFTPSTNLNQLSITELVSVTSIQVLSSGNALPAPVSLTSADFSATSTPGTAEKYEGMRVAVANAIAVSGSDGNITESSATSSSTGVFHVVMTDVARPFREPGLGVLDNFPIPGGKTPPRFDTNQERLMVRSRGQIGATALAIDADTFLSNMVGVLDYFSGAWAILPDAGAPPTLVGGKMATAVNDPSYDDVTIGAFNLLRFFDEVNNSNGAPTLTASALDKRLTKTSLAICDYLKSPDILGVVEVENLRVLGLLADRINSTCASAPGYVPYLVQGNDVGGINVGFLVSNRSVGAVNRVEVVEVVQYGKTTTLSNPDTSTSLLNDRPPLLLRAIVHQDNGATFPVTVIVNHLRSLNGIDDATPGSSGWPTESERVRTKRARQAAFLADLVETRQQADPNERIVLLGDFNAFEFSDGYADVLGIVRGDEVAEPTVLTYLASPITAPLYDGSSFTADPDERYSYVFDGNAQTLDHVLVNEAVVLDAADVVVEHARINADFGVHNFGIAGNGIRVSDHDPVLLYLKVRSFQDVDLAVSVSNPDSSLNSGNSTTYAVNVSNLNASEAVDNAVLSLTLDAAIAGVNVTAAAGWTCAAPVLAAASTSVECTALTFAASAVAAFSVVVPVPGAFLDGDLTLSASISAEQGDSNPANNIGSDFVTIIGKKSDLAVRTRGASRIYAGYKTRINTVADNYGPDAAENVVVAITTNASASFFKITTVPTGWSCALDPAYPSARFLCSLAAGTQMATGARPEFVLTFTAPASMASSNLIIGAGISASTSDPSVGNNENSYSLYIEPLRGSSIPAN